jgi:hypothetical protein
MRYVFTFRKIASHLHRRNAISSSKLDSEAFCASKHTCAYYLHILVFKNRTSPFIVERRQHSGKSSRNGTLNTNIYCDSHPLCRIPDDPKDLFSCADLAKSSSQLIFLEECTIALNLSYPLLGALPRPALKYVKRTFFLCEGTIFIRPAHKSACFVATSIPGTLYTSPAIPATTNRLLYLGV